MSHALDILRQVIPNDHARQVDLAQMFRETASAGDLRVLDLGCGDGRAADILKSPYGRVEYHGLDIEDSPEVRERRRQDVSFKSFDGVNIPYPDGHFDVVYSHQVFEHVRHPEPLIAEVQRVLKPEGVFLGSVSQLEPLHSYSIFNFTPYGMMVVLKAAGLEPLWMRPGIDGVTITLRSLLGRGRTFFNRWYGKPSPVNRYIDLRAKLRGKSPAEVNAEKLTVSGQFVFAARRPA